MGLVGSVGFALKCLDVLAWPLLALGYPLYASILAIETNSSADAQKLVTYWVLFSLISLVEHALGTLLLWLPFWPYIKLAFIAWLMIPHFDGAFYVYEHLVRPCFSISSPLIICGLNKRKELSLKGEDFLVVAEIYLNENRPEALEKLLSTQSMCKKPMVAPKSIVEAEVKEKKEVVAMEESSYNKNTVGLIKDNWVAELKDCNEVNIAEAKVDGARPNLTLPMPSSVQDFGQVPLQEGRKEWTCALCQVTTNGESVLKSHLQGKKHNAALKVLKAKKRPLLFNDTRKAILEVLKAKKQPLLFNDIRKATLEALKQQSVSKDARKVNTTDQSKQGTNKRVTRNGIGQPWCSICDITCSGIGNFVQHCNGKKHMARIEEVNQLN